MSMPSQIQDVLYSVQVVVHCRYPGQRVPSTLANISRAKRLGGEKFYVKVYHITCTRAARQLLMADDGS
jgi:hypothetical protein